METYSTFKNKHISEKIVLAHVDAKCRVFTFSVYSGNIYEKTMDEIVVEVTQNGTSLTTVSDKDSVISGTYYFDILTKKLYIYSTTITTDKIIVDYRLFFSNSPINLPYDLNTGSEVFYEPRIEKTSGISIKISEELTGTALIGKSNISLNNADGFFDEMFNKYIWENKTVSIYSYNRNIAITESKTIYRGVILSKKKDDKLLQFSLIDSMDILKSPVATERFDASDNVIDDIEGIYKRRIFGRVDGFQLQSIDMYNESQQITGTVSGTTSTTTLNGIGTSFLTELSIGDTLFIDAHEYTVEEITSNTILTLGDDLVNTLTNVTASVEYSEPSVAFNREWLVSPKILSEPSTQITEVENNTTVLVNDTSIFRVGDKISINTSPTEYKTVSRIIASNNELRFTEGFDTTPNTSHFITRLPVQNLYYDKRLVQPNFYSVTNDSNGCKVTFASDFEENIVISSKLNDFTYTRTSTSDEIYVTSTGAVQPSTNLKSNDYVSFDNATFYSIQGINGNGLIILRSKPAGSNSGTLYFKKVKTLDNDSIISVDIYGETIDSTKTSTWVRNTPQLYKKLITELGYDSLMNADSFDDSNENNIISITSPSSYIKKSEPFKKLIDKLGQTTRSVLSVDQNLELKYVSINNEIDYDNLIIIGEHDVISWKAESVSPDLYSDVASAYNFKDINYLTEETSSSLYEYINEFVEDYVGVEKVADIDLYLNDENQAEYTTQRYSFMKSLASTVYSLTSDLRYVDLEIGDIIQLDFLPEARLVMVLEIKKTDNIFLKISDFGQLFERRLVITSDSANDYTSADDDEKLISGYITTANGLVNDEENTNNKNLIN